MTWSVWTWQTPSPRLHIQTPHTHAHLLVETNSEWGRHEWCFFRTDFSYRFRLVCFVWHHHQKILSFRWSILLLKDKNKKSLEDAALAQVRFPTAVLPSVREPSCIEWESPLYVCRWSRSKLHLLSPNYVHCVRDEIRGLFEKNNICFTISFNCKDN